MSYLGNDRNIVRDATLSATNIVPSSAIFRTDTDPKIGGGKVTLTGPYSGQSDTTIDVEILDAVGDSSRLSQPVFAGIGNGVMSALTATGVDAQAFQVTVEDLGTETRAAYAPFQGVNIVARASGSAGNNITIDVDHSGLLLADTDFSLQEDIKQGTNEYIGDHWNFNAATLNPDGSIPATAPRVVFGEDPQVYRAYRKYRDGRYVYGFSPSPVRDASKGSQVHLVTGSRTITVTDGTSTDTLTGVVTLYDALAKMRDNSTLVIPDAAIINATLPGGMGAVDLSVWTTSYIIGVDNSGSDAIKHSELIVMAADDAPTETLEVRCVNAEVTGSEKWEVRGDVSLRLADAITNALYSSGGYSFRIDPPEIPNSTPGNTIGSIELDAILEDRADGENYPRISFFRPQIGAAARNGTYSFIWTKRTPESCDEDGTVIGGPDADCLGVTPIGDTNVSDASRIIRLQRLTAATNLAVRANTGPSSKSSVFDVAFIEKGASIHADGLRRMSAGTTRYPIWVASTVYAEDVIVEPITRDGFMYAVTTGGTSGASEPTWDNTVGNTTSDGAVTWTNIGAVPYLQWDGFFDEWVNEIAMLSGVGPKATATTWSSTGTTDSSTAGLIVGDFVKPSTPNGCIYIATAGTGSAGGTVTFGDDEPDWPTDVNGTPANRSVVAFSALSPGYYSTFALAWRYWQASARVELGTIARPGNGRTYKITTAGITGTSEPTWGTAGTAFSDGTASWTEIPAVDLSAAPDQSYFERYSTAMNAVLAAAGIDSNFDFAGVDGDGCWQDQDTEGFWVSTDGYLPWFTNIYGHACRQYYDADGNPYNASTHEFGFGIQVGCPQFLKFGDKVILNISGVQGGSTGRGYQEGDTYYVRVNHAELIPFGGGQTGDDTITFSVLGSVDGRLGDYALVTTALAAYSDSSGSGSLGFQITPGGIRFALGDRFTFQVEGGHFRWRQDGGSWSISTDISTTSVGSGLSLNFAGGIAPSWVDGDVWSFKAEATSGADQLRQPTDARCAWTGSTVIDVTPTSGVITGLFIGDHSIPSDAVIRLQGSDDGFSTTPVDQVVPWKDGNIWFAYVGNRARWRVTIDKGGSANWLWLGTSMFPKIPGDQRELGLLTKKIRLPGVGKRAGLGGDVEHAALTLASVDDLVSMLSHACEYDDRRFGFVPNESEGIGAIVQYLGDSLEVQDFFGFQPTDTANRLQSVRLTLEPTP